MKPTKCKYRMRNPGHPGERKPEEERKKVAVTGSKGMTYDHWNWFCKTMDRATFPLLDPVILAWGWSDKTVDKYAANWASLNWYVLKVYYPDAAKGSIFAAARKRDERLVKDADYLAILWDGVDPWCEYLADLAKGAGVRIKIFEF